MEERPSPTLNLFKNDDDESNTLLTGGKNSKNPKDKLKKLPANLKRIERNINDKIKDLAATLQNKLTFLQEYFPKISFLFVQNISCLLLIDIISITILIVLFVVQYLATRTLKKLISGFFLILAIFLLATLIRFFILYINFTYVFTDIKNFHFIKNKKNNENNNKESNNKNNSQMEINPIANATVITKTDPNDAEDVNIVHQKWNSFYFISMNLLSIIFLLKIFFGEEVYEEKGSNKINSISEGFFLIIQIIISLFVITISSIMYYWTKPLCKPDNDVEIVYEKILSYFTISWSFSTLFAFEVLFIFNEIISYFPSLIFFFILTAIAVPMIYYYNDLIFSGLIALYQICYTISEEDRVFTILTGIWSCTTIAIIVFLEIKVFCNGRFIFLKKNWNDNEEKNEGKEYIKLDFDGEPDYGSSQ